MTALLVALALLVLLNEVPREGRLLQSVSAQSPRANVDDALRRRLVVANLADVVSEPTLAWLAAVGVGAAVGAVVAGFLGVVGGAVGGAVMPWLVLAYRGDQTSALLTSQLPGLLEASARNLRSGAPFLDSLVHAAPVVGPLRADIDHVQRSVRHGLPVEQAIERWVLSRPGIEAIRIVASTMIVGLQTGVDLASSFEVVADNMRRSAELGDQTTALAGQAKASSMVIGLAPLAFLAVSTAAGTSITVLFGSWLGIAALLAGLVLDGIGLWWMRRIIGSVISR